MPNRIIHDIIAQQKIITTDASSTVRDAAIYMTEARVGAVMIVDGGQLTGIFTERDLLNRVVAKKLDLDTTPLSKVMTVNPRTITADKTLAHALILMDDGGYRHVPVVNGGRPIGMVSARDALGSELLEYENEMQRRSHLSEIMV